MTLSMENLQVVQAGAIQFRTRSGVSRYPFVIMAAITPRRRIAAMISSNSGCNSGSPPESVNHSRA